MSSGRWISFTLGLLVIGGATSAPMQKAGLGWPTHGGNAQHTAASWTPAQPLSRVVWSAPIDLNPQYNGDVLYAHYGSAVISAENLVVLPVKTGANGGFRVEARNGKTGRLLWQQNSDYVTPGHNWFPTFGPAILGKSVLYPRKAGLLGSRGLASSATPQTVCFYGIANYQANPAAYDAAVRISSPITVYGDGWIAFTYRVEGETPIGLKGGLAVISPRGQASYVEAASLEGNAEYYRPKLNCAPAIFNGVVYAVFKKGGGNDGVMVGIDLQTLSLRYRTPLIDPLNGGAAYIDDDGTACPTIGPDGDVYFGVLENPFGSHHYRGWLLHFDKTLTQTKTPGSFGWDDSPSIVPSNFVPSYAGNSSYLVMTKYNNYAGAGDGVNKIAVLDPNASQADPYSSATVMKEVLTKVGPTPDGNHTGSFPNAVREWCINTAAVDLKNRSIIVNNEDGFIYRWNLETNTLDQGLKMTDGIGQAYTTTIIGPNGLVYGVSNARIYAIGN